MQPLMYSFVYCLDMRQVVTTPLNADFLWLLVLVALLRTVQEYNPCLAAPNLATALSIHVILIKVTIPKFVKLKKNSRVIYMPLILASNKTFIQ